MQDGTKNRLLSNVSQERCQTFHKVKHVTCLRCGGIPVFLHHYIYILLMTSRTENYNHDVNRHYGYHLITALNSRFATTGPLSMTLSYFLTEQLCCILHTVP